MTAMAIQFSIGAILGICLGAATCIVLIGTSLVVLCLRRKHKALIASRNGDSGRQPRAHLSITDEDVFRMPGMRRLQPLPYGHPAGWEPISSGESIAKRGFAPNPADIDLKTGAPPWTVRNLRRTNKIVAKPLVRKPSGALSPITERSNNNTATPPSLSTAAISDDGTKEASAKHVVKGVYQPSGRPNFDMSNLKPKPLFHGQPRSLSHGALSKSSQSIKSDVPLQDLQATRIPRSSSLCSQPPGQAPTIPVPPLPFELPIKQRIQPMTSPSQMSPQRVSGMSLLSGDTSVLNEPVSRGFSEAETAFTSTSLTSNAALHLTPIGLGISDVSNAKWNFSRIDRSASPISVSKARDIRPPLSQQHSFRASIHSSLPRNPSSGLSMSLLDPNFPTPEAARKSIKPGCEIPGDNRRQRSRRSKVPKASPLNGKNVFQVSEDKKAKRASTSVLNVVSGNQSSPIKDPWIDRPTSIATEDPFRWDPKSSMKPSKPSAMKTGGQRHKRQSCVRISNIP
ncbi:MAG: hypothetical protein Q9201_002315, partial [Fulgogasparrea decipioides]